ncbi:MAG: FtsW/RodA/SpoVE family cell cycle protein [Myxococcota bacterium]|nr:FtsW/RodA/SpoVE family cell cycle protein [Myxococcota bacterium]
MSRRPAATRRTAPPESAPGAPLHGLEPAAALLTAAALLAALGAVMIFSATAPLALDRTVPPHFLRHLGALAAAALLAAAVSRLPLRAFHVAALPLWGLSLGLLAATAFVGHEAGGARRWLPVPGLGLAVQPAELAKLATVLAASALLARRDGRGEVAPRRFALVLGLAAAPAALCLLQPDFGNAVLLGVLAGCLLFAAGAPLRALLGPALGGAAVVAAWSLAQPYALRRWLGFLDPWARAGGEGFQLVQSFVAFGRGGLFGVGLGDGRQKLFYLPEAHTDFILSVVAEELGLAGVLLVLGAFAALALAGLRIALEARQRFAALLAFGATVLLAVPALLNAAVVMGLVPTKGLTLPFLSYGRSSLLVSALAVGLLLAVARAGRAPARRGSR